MATYMDMWSNLITEAQLQLKTTSNSIDTFI